MARPLLKYGADPGIRFRDGSPALVGAVSAGQAAIVGRLPNAGADPNALAVDGDSVLAKAIRAANARMIGTLLNAGADPDGPGVLESAVRLNDPNVAKALPEAGAPAAEAPAAVVGFGVITLAAIPVFIEGALCPLTLFLGR